MDAQYVIFNRFMGRRPPGDRAAAGRAHAGGCSRDDGSWPLYHGGPGHLSTTIEAYFAMKLAGLPADASGAARARASSSGRTAASSARASSRARFLAYFGQFPWWGLPAMPVELVLLPPWFPLNIYAMSSWARETVVPLTVLMAKQPRIAIPAGVRRRGAVARAADAGAASAFRRSREWLVGAQRVPRARLGPAAARPQPVEAVARARAAPRAQAWILERQDRNGGWGGIQPPMLNCVMALRALGYPDDHPAVAQGRAGDRGLPDRARRPALLPAVRVADVGHGAHLQGAARLGPARRRTRRWCAPPSG